MGISSSYVGLLDHNHPKQPGFMNPEVSTARNLILTRTWLEFNGWCLHPQKHDHLEVFNPQDTVNEWLLYGAILHVWVWQIPSETLAATEGVSTCFYHLSGVPHWALTFLTFAGGKSDIIQFHWAVAKSYMARHEGVDSAGEALKSRKPCGLDQCIRTCLQPQRY